MKGEPDTRLPSRSAWASRATAAWSQPCWALETVAGPGYRRGPPKGWSLPCVGPQGARGTPGCAWEPGSAWPAVDGALSLRAGRCACVCYVKHEDALQGGSTEPPPGQEGTGSRGQAEPPAVGRAEEATGLCPGRDRARAPGWAGGKRKASESISGGCSPVSRHLLGSAARGPGGV